jgi:four helix bundle protein
MSFAVSILRFVDAAHLSVAGQVAARQLARSATSIGSNYRAACTARSRAEFIAKLCTVNEEADETVHWLELMGLSGYVSESVLKPLTQEAIELRAIFGTSLRTARRNDRANRLEPRRRGR